MRVRQAVAAVLASLALAGCSMGTAAIEGSVETVVTECQEMSTSDEAKVRVTGETPDYGTYLTDEPSAGDFAIIVLQSDEDGTYLAFCNFEEITQEQIDAIGDGGRVTVTGTVSGEDVESDSVFLRDCDVE